MYNSIPETIVSPDNRRVNKIFTARMYYSRIIHVVIHGIIHGIIHGYLMNLTNQVGQGLAPAVITRQIRTNRREQAPALPLCHTSRMSSVGYRGDDTSPRHFPLTSYTYFCTYLPVLVILVYNSP